MIVRPRDWIRFYSNGRFVIAQVEYIVVELGHEHALTDAGKIRVDCVVEVRSPGAES